MNSHLLVNVASEAKAKEALCSMLPGQEQPWLLRSAAGDPVAYFNVGSEFEGKPNVHVQADISGRHFGCDDVVVEALRQLQAFIGGAVINDS